MRFIQLSCPRGRCERLWTQRPQRWGNTGVVRHPAQAVAESHRGAKAPSPVGNLPSERYLTRDLLLPATLDRLYCTSISEKSKTFFEDSPYFLPCPPKTTEESPSRSLVLTSAGALRFTALGARAQVQVQAQARAQVQVRVRARAQAPAQVPVRSVPPQALPDG